MNWKDKFPQENRYFETDNGILYKADCLEIMKKFPKESIDLIYIDPPFGIDRDKVFGLPKWKSIEEHYKFCDNLGLSIIRKIDKKGKKSNYGIAHYLYWIYERLKIMRELLNSKGSIYVHLDWHSSHYVKVIMDEIFGKENFVNEIVWKRTGAHNNSKAFGRNVDFILFYSKTQSRIWNVLRQKYSEEHIRRYFKKDNFGRWYRLNNPTGQGYQNHTRNFGRGNIKPPSGRHWSVKQETIDKWIKEGRIVFSNSGYPFVKVYLDELEGNQLQSLWDDIVPSRCNNKLLNYPTQKPEQLLERIILASSYKGNIIADFFSGSGTTLIVAEKLGRKWVGCDFNVKACKITKERIMKLQKDLL